MFISPLSSQGVLGAMHQAFDIESLRHELADRLDILPVEEWSTPLLLAVIGLLDAYALSRELARKAGKPRLRVVALSTEPCGEFVKEGVV